MLKLDNDKFIEGQNAFARGIGLRPIIEQVENLDDDSKSSSLMFGYLDGVFAAIRRIDNLLMFPKGPDG